MPQECSPTAFKFFFHLNIIFWTRHTNSSINIVNRGAPETIRCDPDIGRNLPWHASRVTYCCRSGVNPGCNPDNNPDDPDYNPDNNPSPDNNPNNPDLTRTIRIISRITRRSSGNPAQTRVNPAQTNPAQTRVTNSAQTRVNTAQT